MKEKVGGWVCGKIQCGGGKEDEVADLYAVFENLFWG